MYSNKLNVSKSWQTEFKELNCSINTYERQECKLLLEANFRSYVDQICSLNEQDLDDSICDYYCKHTGFDNGKCSNDVYCNCTLNK